MFQKRKYFVSFAASPSPSQLLHSLKHLLIASGNRARDKACLKGGQLNLSPVLSPSFIRDNGFFSELDKAMLTLLNCKEGFGFGVVWFML